MSLSKPAFHTLENTGRGAWYALLLMCSEAKTPEQKQACLYLIHLYATKFFCKKCRDHFAAFVKADPPERYLSEARGLFVWAWRARNNANAIKGAPHFPYEDAEIMYYGSTAVCDKGCDEHDLPKVSVATEGTSQTRDLRLGEDLSVSKGDTPRTPMARIDIIPRVSVATRLRGPETLTPIPWTVPPRIEKLPSVTQSTLMPQPTTPRPGFRLLPPYQ